MAAPNVNDGADVGYTWEGDYERTWEAIQEDESGSLRTAVDDIVQKAKRKRMLDRPRNIRIGIMRHMFLVIDMSSAMNDMDLKPTRIHSVIKLLESFVEEYFDQNPISQIGVIITKNKRAEIVSDLGGNPQRHVAKLTSLINKQCVGEASLQNGLDVAIQILKHVPAHASREVLVVFGGLTTCDPGDIYETVNVMKDANIRCSIIGLAAEVRVCKRICQITKGEYAVILDEYHFKDLLSRHIIPPPVVSNVESSLIRMGFPQHKVLTDQLGKQRLAMCMCHLDCQGSEGFSATGFFCPQCNSKYCELPVECKACGLTLVSAPHLARSYHHLFPLDVFNEVITADADNTRHCTGCHSDITASNTTVYECTQCRRYFCFDCDVFIHESLHCCPGCSSSLPNHR